MVPTPSDHRPMVPAPARGYLFKWFDGPSVEVVIRRKETNPLETGAASPPRKLVAPTFFRLTLTDRRRDGTAKRQARSRRLHRR